MEVTAYELALISGGFTIVGALIGGVATYWLNSVQIAKDSRRLAGIKLREAFSQEIALLERTTEDENDTSELLKSAFVKHQAAINDFRAHLTGKEISRFNEAWVKYYGYYDDEVVQDIEHFAKYYKHNDRQGRSKAIEHINKILAFAEPPKLKRLFD